MSTVLLIGCGDLGGEIAQLLASQHHVYGVRASDKPVPNGVQRIVADVTNPDDLSALSDLKPDILIYCVAAREQSDASYQQHYVQGLANVLATQHDNPHLCHVFFVSSTRVYGQASDEMISEQTPALAADFGGTRLLQAESLLNGLSCRHTVLRLSGIYGAGRLYLVSMAKSPSTWPTQNVWTNRIHRDDAARFIAYLCEKVFNQQAVDDCYIVTDDLPVPQREVLMWLADQQGVDVSAVGELVASGGKRLSNQRLRATDFKLKYPDYQAGYCQVLQEMNQHE